MSLDAVADQAELTHPLGLVTRNSARSQNPPMTGIKWSVDSARTTT